MHAINLLAIPLHLQHVSDGAGGMSAAEVRKEATKMCQFMDNRYGPKKGVHGERSRLALLNDEDDLNYSGGEEGTSGTSTMKVATHLTKIICSC